MIKRWMICGVEGEEIKLGVKGEGRKKVKDIIESITKKLKRKRDEEKSEHEENKFAFLTL
tara:strand:+ start:84 stop:263 length:180 start_codon:yes stop_codon:yes gene_type:complete